MAIIGSLAACVCHHCHLIETQRSYKLPEELASSGICTISRCECVSDTGLPHQHLRNHVSTFQNPLSFHCTAWLKNGIPSSWTMVPNSYGVVSPDQKRRNINQVTMIISIISPCLWSFKPYKTKAKSLFHPHNQSPRLIDQGHASIAGKTTLHATICLQKNGWWEPNGWGHDCRWYSRWVTRRENPVFIDLVMLTILWAIY